MIGLYVHIPFCTKKCHYCDFVIALSGPDGRHERFLDALAREADVHAARFKDTVFDTVYLGGGTPSTLEAAEFKRLFDILKRRFRWKSGAEVTCEVNPGDVDSRKADVLAQMGINRVSLGAQSFHDRTLARINRTHTAAQTEASFRILHGAGFRNINLDLILSLPGEFWPDVHESLQKALALGPQHISVYELTVEERTVFGALKARGELGMPEEDEQFEILSNARAYLKAEGFHHYELLNYARPGYESKHNLLYWANEPYLGLGPGAWSYVDDVRYRFADSYQQYLTKTQSGDRSNAEEDLIDEGKRRRESLLLALRLTKGAARADFEDVLRVCAEDIDSLEERGLIERDEERVRLTARGQLMAETVFTELAV